MAELTQPVLQEQEEQELHDGRALYEMTQSEGWKIFSGWLSDMAFHSWVDPRSSESKEDWMWKELNLYHSANIAKELLEGIQKSVNQSDFLMKKKSGEIKNRSMRV